MLGRWGFSRQPNYIGWASQTGFYCGTDYRREDISKAPVLMWNLGKDKGKKVNDNEKNKKE